jgi:hypothetical protein
MTAPSGALTWTSTKDRNRVLKLWRHAVFAVFAEQPRAIRIASVLVDLFNVKKGYCFATNAYLAQETSIAANKLRATLLILEDGGAIIRANVTNPDTGQVQRVIYPATAIIPRPALGQGEPHLGAEGGSPAAGAPESEKNTPHPKLADRAGESRERTARQAQEPRCLRPGLRPRDRRAAGCTTRGLSEQRSDRRWQGHTPDRGGHGRHVSKRCRWQAHGCE